MNGSVHLRGIVIAGVLAAMALALGLVTLGMNQTASQAAPPKTILPLKLRHHAPAAAKTTKATQKKKAAKKKLDRNYVAALKAGLPRSVAHALAAHSAVVVELTSASDAVAQLSAGEAKAGAALAGASYVAVNVDSNGGDVEVLTRLIGKLPVTPAALIYTRPAKLVATLPGFNDRTVVQQAVANALPDPAAASGVSRWAAKANAICAATSGEPSSYAVFAQQQAKLDAIKPPAGQAAVIRAANTKLHEALALLKRARAKQASGKAGTAEFSQALVALAKAFVTYNGLGATVCASSS